MFDAIEDITTEKLIAELMSRGNFVVKSHKTPMRYLVWSDNDPNDCFEVDASNVYDAAFGALYELGWCVSGDPYDPEDEEDEEDEDA